MELTGTIIPSQSGSGGNVKEEELPTLQNWTLPLDAVLYHTQDASFLEGSYLFASWLVSWVLWHINLCRLFKQITLV